MDTSTLLHDVGLVILAAVTSCAGTVAVFSSRLAVMDVERRQLAAQIERDRAQDKALLDQRLGGIAVQLERQERLLRAVLELSANLAHGEGKDRRAITDGVLTRYLNEG